MKYLTQINDISKEHFSSFSFKLGYLPSSLFFCLFSSWSRSFSSFHTLPLSLRFFPGLPQSFHLQYRCFLQSVYVCRPMRGKTRFCRCLTSQRGPSAVRSVMTKTLQPLADWPHIELQWRPERTDVCREGGLDSDLTVTMMDRLGIWGRWLMEVDTVYTI